MSDRVANLSTRTARGFGTIVLVAAVASALTGGAAVALLSGGAAGGQGFVPLEAAPAPLAPTVVVGPATGTVQVVYLLDPPSDRLLVYTFNTATRQLVLAAARNVEHDKQLASYNTQPAPAEIAEMLRQAAPEQTHQPRP